jgi:peroxiredoxin
MSFRTPKYRLHKGSGQALVQLNGERIYLGKFNTKESKEKYRRLVAEFLASGPDGSENAAVVVPSLSPIWIKHLIIAYWRFAKSHYVRNGQPTGTLAGIRGGHANRRYPAVSGKITLRGLSPVHVRRIPALAPRRPPLFRNHRRTHLVILGLLWCASSGLSLCHADTLEIGSPAPDFNLPAVDGKTYSLGSFREADILVIVFTCNHCPTAQAYEGRIKQLAADYKDKEVAVVAISPNDPEAVRLDELGYSNLGDSFQDMKLRAKEHGFNFPYLYDGDNQKVARAYGPVSTPHVFVFDRQRKLRFVGRIDDSEKPELATSHDTRNAIEALLAGKPVPVETTKVFGCSIKWSEKRESVKRSLETWAQEEVGLQVIDEKGIRALVKNDTKRLRLINVWATWCGPCVAELPEFVSINRMYRNRDFELVTISADAAEDKGRALEVLKKKQVSASNYLFDGDNKYKLMDAVDVKASGPVPHTILVAPGGKVLYRKSGSCEPMAIKCAIVDYLGRTYK